MIRTEASPDAMVVVIGRRPAAVPMTESLLTPSKITAWLDCDHFLTLAEQVDAGTRSSRHPASARWRSC